MYTRRSDDAGLEVNQMKNKNLKNKGSKTSCPYRNITSPYMVVISPACFKCFSDMLNPSLQLDFAGPGEYFAGYLILGMLLFRAP
jgi:hypothetical protein